MTLAGLCLAFCTGLEKGCAVPRNWWVVAAMKPGTQWTWGIIIRNALQGRIGAGHWTGVPNPFDFSQLEPGDIVIGGLVAETLLREGRRPVGQPFFLLAPKQSPNRFYCTKLVWWAYHQAGFDRLPWITLLPNSAGRTWFSGRSGRPERFDFFALSGPCAVGAGPMEMDFTGLLDS